MKSISSLIDVHDDELVDAYGECQGEPEQRDRDQVVVSEQEDPAAGDRVRFVHGEHPPQLRLRGAVTLIELDEWLRREFRDSCEPAAQSGNRRREGDATPTATRTRRLDRRWP